jgi:uncharacterized membrane protein
MGPNRILGVILLVVGVILLYFGLRATDTLGESIKEGVTGTYTDRTTWFLVGGAVAAVVGALLTFFGGGRRTIAA